MRMGFMDLMRERVRSGRSTRKVRKTEMLIDGRKESSDAMTTARQLGQLGL